MRLIDADRLLDRCKFYHLPNGDLAVPIIDVQHAPTIEPERKKGEWVDAKDGYDGHVKCNKCFKTYDWTRDAQYFNYCPNCGCQMGGENNV